MELFLDVLGESLVDTAKMLPFLFLAYLLIEYIETRHGERIEALLAGGGRWGAIPGAMLGGYIMGIAESLTKGYISTQLADAVVFGILIVVLLVKPSGIMGKHATEKV